MKGKPVVDVKHRLSFFEQYLNMTRYCTKKRKSDGKKKIEWCSEHNKPGDMARL